MMSTIDLSHSRFPNDEQKEEIASHQKREKKGNRAYDTSIFMGSIPTFNHEKGEKKIVVDMTKGNEI